MKKEVLHTNRLINETSPYLLQHAHNPVDWYPWCEEAFVRASSEDKPILLSIGYSACHWCHVMEHESFENEEIAALMNKYFINIKVDREERPDLDNIYMSAVQMLTGRGGWPMTMFLTPEKLPFFGGTYYPPSDRYGMPGFPRVLLSVAESYKLRRSEILGSANEILSEINKMQPSKSVESLSLDRNTLDQASSTLSRRFDWQHGGFGQAPKFPNSPTLSFLLQHWFYTKNQQALEMAEISLTRMSQGGIYDHVGGGFHRYSTDSKWLVPHFEKMLYDNALLSQLYVEAYLITGKSNYCRVVEETLDYVIREMTSPEGGFYSTQDADSEGEEGKFFTWKKSEIDKLLGKSDSTLFCRFYDISEEGNFEKVNILNTPESLESIAKLKGVSEEKLIDVLNTGRKVLFAEREKRIKPHRDEKQITSWNGLMLSGFAKAATALKRDDYLQVAINNAEFIFSRLYKDGRLFHTYKDGISKFNAYLEDYAFYAKGLLDLYEATFDIRWLIKAKELVDLMIDLFWDKNDGGFFFTSRDHEDLISRTKDSYDNATPSGNSVAANVLLRLSILTDNADYWEKAEGVLALFSNMMGRMPSGFGNLLCASEFCFFPHKEIVIVGDLKSKDTEVLLSILHSTYLPNTVLVHRDPKDINSIKTIPMLDGRMTVDGKATVLICENYTCKLPITSPEDLISVLKSNK